jgi:hypothetical protein
MSIIRIILTAIFSIFSALGIASVLLGKTPVSALIIASAYILTTMALYNKGGKSTKYIGYITGFILGSGILISIYALIMPLLGSKFEPLLFISTLVIGLVGIATIIQLKSKQSLV